MRSKVFLLLGVVVIMAGLSGCATAGKNKDMEIQGLRNQITVLESQLQNKEEEVNSLKYQLDSQSQAKEKAVRKLVPETKSRPTTKQIQKALSNAGYDPGPVDGRKGRQTREAIRAFQRANNLRADGVVGKRTWALLGKYLYEKVK